MGSEPIITSTYSSAGNFPNPLEAASGFKTAIPFITKVPCSATIRIADANGNEVFTDRMDAGYAGEHFFYFTGDKLTSGSYYYTIEAPKGVAIVNKTLLVVR